MTNNLKNTKNLQVLDDAELLEIMLEDSKKSLDIYKPTNYWNNYEKIFVRELKKLGLKDFRRRKNSILSGFSATDLYYSLGKINLYKNKLLYNKISKYIPFWSKFLFFQNTLLNKIFPVSGSHTTDDIDQLFYRYAKLYGEKCGAKSINDFEASLYGNPEHVIRANNNLYTIRILNFYMRYSYVCQYLNFNNIKIMVELGSGSGKQIEVIKKLHPNICFLLFDIPPQSYVCEQYLKSVFPGEVVSYKDTKMINLLPDDHKGKIFIFGNWKFPILEKINIDLFWNDTSFQEMEPSIVANYLKNINTRANAVFLSQVMEGKEVASKKGSHGVLKKTTLEDYKKGLSNFKLQDLSSTKDISHKGNLIHSNSFWKRFKI
jgi:putative sugar O-methyltransferase